ncbi:hypothetical protein ABPG75_001201 [Micractinium tetrahymenae]
MAWEDFCSATLPALVRYLSSENEALHAAASGALRGLASKHWSWARTIAAALAGEEDLGSSSEEQQVAAAGALRMLATGSLHNKEAVAEAEGMLQALVSCLEEDRPAALQRQAAAALAAMAENSGGTYSPVGRACMAESGMIQALVRLSLRPRTDAAVRQGAEEAIRQLADSGMHKAVQARQAITYQERLQRSDIQLLHLAPG